MTKKEHEQKIQNAVAEYVAVYPNSALALITSLFVGLLEIGVEKNDGDKDAEIKIEGGNRSITVHPTNRSVK